MLMTVALTERNNHTSFISSCIIIFFFLNIPFPYIVKPSKPRCYTEGLTQEGKDIVLRCTSNDGTKPIQYSWEKTSNGKVLPASGVIGNALVKEHHPSNKTEFAPLGVPLQVYFCHGLPLPQTQWEVPSM